MNINLLLTFHSAAHGIVGMIVMALTIIVPALGQATAVMSDAPKRILIIPDRAHVLLGYASPFVAYAAIFLGLHKCQARWFWYFLVSLWIFIITVAYWSAFIIQLIFSIRRNKQNKKANAAFPVAEEEDSWSDGD